MKKLITILILIFSVLFIWKTFISYSYNDKVCEMTQYLQTIGYNKVEPIGYRLQIYVVFFS
jgi:predicted negative regulator of RcsB-dependent stress response